MQPNGGRPTPETEPVDPNGGRPTPEGGTPVTGKTTTDEAEPAR
jgi:hypothetical protein